MIQTNDSDITDESGSYALDVEVCNNSSTTFSHVFNFVLGDGGWTVGAISGGTQGLWVAGTGWTDGFNQQSGAGYRLLAFSRSFPARVLTKVSTRFVLTQGEHTFASGDVDIMQGLLAAVATTLHSVDYRTPPASPWEWVGSQSFDKLFIQLMAGIHLGTGDPGGSVVCGQLTVEGIGTDPF